MSFDLALARISELQRAFVPTPHPAASSPQFGGALQSALAGAGPELRSSLGTMGAGLPSFGGILGAQSAGPAGVMGFSPGQFGGIPGVGVGGQAMVGIAGGEVGVTEQPPGSNDSPRIGQYRQATAGAGVGPWCAYFVSWVARQAGAPLGETGQGFGSVQAVWSWAQRSGKAIGNQPGVMPGPGDLIVWDQHIGIVEGVDASGQIHTVEGNSSDAVSRRTYGPDGGGALGYVRLG